MINFQRVNESSRKDNQVPHAALRAAVENNCLKLLLLLLLYCYLSFFQRSAPNAITNGGIRTCLEVSSDPMFLWIFSNSCPLSLLLVRSHQAEITIVKIMRSGGRKDDAFAF